MLKKSNNWVVITGASSGIGYEIALELAQHDINIIAIARRSHLLDKLKTELALKNCECHILSLDITTTNAANTITSFLSEQGIAPIMLINNAGCGLFGDFRTQDAESLRNMLTLNVTALTDITRQIMPMMDGRGQVVFIASTLAYVPSPYYAAYAATKTYVHTFAQALRYEKNPPIITTVYPGITNTDFFKISQHKLHPIIKKLLMKQPKFVAKKAVKGILSNKKRIIPGFMNKVMVMLNHLLPRALMIVFVRLILSFK